MLSYVGGASMPETIKECREFWADIARANGWYFEPFYIQVWRNPITGQILDSVGHEGMKNFSADVIIDDYGDECDFCSGGYCEGCLSEFA